MPKKGGYKIVSLHKIDLLGEDLVLAGLYLALINSYDKPIMLSDINIDGEIKKDALVQAEKGQNKVTIKNLYGYDLEISNEDAITVAPSPDGIELPVPSAEDDGRIVGVNVEGKYVLKPSVEDQIGQAPAGTINKVLGLDEDGELVKGDAPASGGTKLYKHEINSDFYLIDNKPELSIITEYGSFKINGVTAYSYMDFLQLFARVTGTLYAGFKFLLTYEDSSVQLVVNYLASDNSIKTAVVLDANDIASLTITTTEL